MTYQNVASQMNCEGCYHLFIQLKDLLIIEFIRSQKFIRNRLTRKMQEVPWYRWEGLLSFRELVRYSLLQ